jgi:hypothetical protein
MLEEGRANFLLKNPLKEEMTVGMHGLEIIKILEIENRPIKGNSKVEK